MEKSHKVGLSYQEFEDKVETTWRGLQLENEFCDVILACSGGQIRAHKAIISAGSPVLKFILKDTLEKDPLIYLGGVKKATMDNLLNFMYQGEANVPEKDLGNFCKLAKDLEIEGFNK